MAEDRIPLGLKADPGQEDAYVSHVGSETLGSVYLGSGTGEAKREGVVYRCS